MTSFVGSNEWAMMAAGEIGPVRPRVVIRPSGVAPIKP